MYKNFTFKTKCPPHLVFLTRSIEAQLKTLCNSKLPTDTGQFHSSNHQKWLPYEIVGGKAVKNVTRSTNNGYMVDKAKCDVVS